MYEIICFSIMATILLTYCLLNVFMHKKVERYAKKNVKKFLAYNLIFIVAMIVSGLFMVSKYNDRLVINAQEISTGYLYHTFQHSRPSFGLLGSVPPTKLNEFSLWGDTSNHRYKMTDWTLRDDGQTDTYVLEDLETGEERTMRRLYGEDRIYLLGSEILEVNEKIKKGDIKFFYQMDWKVRERNLEEEFFYRGGSFGRRL